MMLKGGGTVPEIEIVGILHALLLLLMGPIYYPTFSLFRHHIIFPNIGLVNFGFNILCPKLT